MNPGYFSCIAITVTAILVWSGWRSLLIGGFTNRDISMFLAAFILGNAIGWSAYGASGTCVYAPLAALIISVMRQPQTWNLRFSFLSYGSLLAAVYSLIELINRLDPLVLAVYPLLHPSLVVAVLSVIYSRQGTIQLGLITVAFLMKDIYMALLYQEHTAPVFGSRTFQDEWWVTGAIARSTALIFMLSGVSVVRATRKLKWMLRRR